MARRIVDPVARRWNQKRYRERSRRKVARQMAASSTDRRHGTATGYRDGRCRCPACQAWKAADSRARRARKSEEIAKAS